MKKTSIVALLVLTVFLLTIAIAMACDCCGSKASAEPAKIKTVSAVCPVMGNKIPDVTKAAGKSVYKGKTYYFCCKGCKPVFDKDPEKYIKSAKK